MRRQKKITSVVTILCVHQGYELYGSDRSFALSVAILHELYPDAKIDVVIPKDGPIRQLLVPVCGNLIVDEGLGILRKKDLYKNPFGLMYKIMRGMMSAVIASKKYNLVYVNTIVVFDYILAARFMKCPVVLHVREIPTGFQRTVFSKALSFSKMDLIFNSSNTLHAFDLPGSQNKTVILNGVKGFTQIPAKNSKSATVNILLIGRLTPWKGQMFFLEALNHLLKHKAYDIKVRIVGDVFENQFAYKHDLRRYAKDCDLGKIVTFKSFTDSPEDEYEWSDIVIVPSVKPEPFGRVAIEAMSASRCVIAANHGGLMEIVEKNKNGVLFEANNSDSLVNALQGLLNTPEMINKYAEQGLQIFKLKFSEEIYKRKFKKVMLIE